MIFLYREKKLSLFQSFMIKEKWGARREIFRCFIEIKQFIVTGFQNSVYIYIAFRSAVEELLSHVQYPLL